MVHVDIDLRYWSNGLQYPLPEWGKFYLELGAAVAQANHSDQRLVTALAVPTRSQAAVLTAAGIVISRVNSAEENLQDSHSDHLEMLSGLPVGTSVTVRRGKKTDKGIWVGTRVNPNDGSKMAGVQTENGKSGALTVWIPESDSKRVQVSSIAWAKLPANSETARDKGASRSEFVSQIVQGMGLLKFAKESALDCIILGNVGLLVKEADGAKLSLGTQGHEESAGTLRDLLRVRRLFTKDESFRSDIFPVNKAENAKLSEQMTPHVVVFDGAVGFLKWRDNWPQSKWLVILDRTEPRFRDAVQVVNEEYLNRTSEEEFMPSSAAPSPVDIVAFTVAK